MTFAGSQNVAMGLRRFGCPPDAPQTVLGYSNQDDGFRASECGRGWSTRTLVVPMAGFGSLPTMGLTHTMDGDNPKHVSGPTKTPFRTKNTFLDLKTRFWYQNNTFLDKTNTFLDNYLYIFPTQVFVFLKMFLFRIPRLTQKHLKTNNQSKNIYTPWGRQPPGGPLPWPSPPLLPPTCPG